MKKLTPEMVIARTKISDLSKVKRLNCWGSELVDVSLLRDMPSVEVLSLSINKINTLADFEKCSQLQELYIRQNDIRDLNQVCYLQGLPNLKNLWLGENPCASNDGYRLSVLRTLPQLQKLDNIAVNPDELKDAAKKGKLLVHPEDSATEDDDYQVQQQYQQQQLQLQAQQQQQQQQQPPQYQRYQQDQSPEYSPHHSPTRTELEEDQPQEVVAEYYEPPEEEKIACSPPRQSSSPKRQETRRSYSPEVVEYQERRAVANSYDKESQQYFEQNTTYEEEFVRQEITRDQQPMRIVTSQSVNNIKDYANGDRFVHSQQQWRHSENNDIPYHSHESVQGSQRREPRYSCPASSALRPPFNRRPVTRNSNILSSVLCLVKELDYPSLEVVEMAVRCRMDELEE